MNVATAMLPRDDGRNRLEGRDGSRGAEAEELRLRRTFACAAEELAAAVAGLRWAISLLHEEEEARTALMLLMLLLLLMMMMMMMI